MSQLESRALVRLGQVELLGRLVEGDAENMEEVGSAPEHHVISRDETRSDLELHCVEPDDMGARWRGRVEAGSESSDALYAFVAQVRWPVAH